MICLHELYELQEKYKHEKLIAEAKISVVSDMIANELEKEKASVAQEETEEVAEEAVSTTII